MKKNISRAATAISITAMALALSSCVFDDWNKDLGDFVERGLSLTKLVSYTHAQEGAAADADVAHGTPVTVTMKILNPKELDLAYDLACDPTLVEPGSLTAVAEGSTADGYTSASFAFTPTALAEHGDVAFTLALRSPSINKQFEPGTVTLRCDCAPSPVAAIVAGPRSDGRSCVGFILPEGYENADVASVRITYSSSTVGTQNSVTEQVSRDGTNLAQAPDVALLDAAESAAARYFIPGDVVAGNPYSYTVVLIDESGKESAPATASVAGNEITLAFDANGGTGTVGARFGFNGSTVEIPSAATLTKKSSSFAGWNTEPDGSGTTYRPGDTYTFTMANQTLYAQWTTLGDIQVVVSNPTYKQLGFMRAKYFITSTYLDKNGKLTLSFVDGATDYKWFVDGGSPVATSATFEYSSVNVGTHVISVTAKIGGVLYSGNLTVTVTDDYMITILPKGQWATFEEEWFTDTVEPVSKKTATHTLTKSYQLARYEVSFALWSDVTVWALEHGYQFANTPPKETHGYNNIGLNNPVSQVPDLDAMIWCNAYSRMTGLTPCYYTTPERTEEAKTVASLSGIQFDYSADYVRWDVNGYRLPTRAEWYYAASCGGLYKYNHVSGNEETDYSMYPSSDYAHVYIAGMATINIDVKAPNAWGLYNMSGNVWEYSFDKYDSNEPIGPRKDYICNTPGLFRVTNGSSFSFAHEPIKSCIGFKARTNINGGGIDDGFRLARSIP